MSTVNVPTKALFGAMLLGAATLGLAKLMKNAPRLKAAAEADVDDGADSASRVDATDVEWRPVGDAKAGGRRGSARAPYADALSHREDGSAHLPGTPAPVEAAKHGDPLGEPFSAGVVGDVAPSAANKGGLGDGGR